ncbi:MAG TPA: flagellar transcriptional regulator FlhD [Oleiagrimonas sp.]|nr:flagellar transcriptional regulator FlhD [Oleiagrimonas sp.]
MNHEELLEEIEETNRAYLMLARRLLRENHAVAQFRLKLDDELADIIKSSSTRELSRLARTNQFVFRPCLESAAQLGSALADKRDPIQVPTHASLMMADATPAS